MSYPKNPLVRYRKITDEFDWDRATSDVHAHLPKVEVALKAFLEQNPLWFGKASTGTFPPHICVWFYLKPGAYPRRKSIGNPDRLAVIPEGDMVPVAELMASVLQQCPGLKAKLWERRDYLIYDLKVANLETYRRKT